MSSSLEPQMNSGSAEIDHHEVLIEVADLIVHGRNLLELLGAVAERLGKRAAAEFTNLALHDPTRDVMRLHVLEGDDLAPPIEIPVADSPGGIAWQTQQPLVVPDVNAETRFPSVVNLLQRKEYSRTASCP